MHVDAPPFFSTFDNVVLEPSPQLNLIVGPNGKETLLTSTIFYFILSSSSVSPSLLLGTGKSSLVCAICLVLCGHTSILGRAKEVSLTCHVIVM